MKKKPWTCISVKFCRITAVCRGTIASAGCNQELRTKWEGKQMSLECGAREGGVGTRADTILPLASGPLHSKAIPKEHRCVLTR
jgi:hypothetical protein